jgi:hypothetical protein
MNVDQYDQHTTSNDRRYERYFVLLCSERRAQCAEGPKLGVLYWQSMSVHVIQIGFSPEPESAHRASCHIVSDKHKPLKIVGPSPQLVNNTVQDLPSCGLHAFHSNQTERMAVQGHIIKSETTLSSHLPGDAGDVNCGCSKPISLNDM